MPVAIEDGGRVPADDELPRTDPLRNGRMEAVGTDDDVGLDVPPRAAPCGDDPANPPSIVDDQIVESDTVVDLCSAVRGRIDQDPVEQRAPRCIQRTHSESLLD